MRDRARKIGYLKRVGLKISRDLHERDKSVDALALEIGMARSTLREIIAGRSNPRLLSLDAIAQGLGYRKLSDFLSDL
ncbi:MAG: helix-turn-helix domain-containing protein [Bdellovibrionales bacterium]|nr:helix-turn-helix domain-containing protein [Bdellovibrionales bacterium]